MTNLEEFILSIIGIFILLKLVSLFMEANYGNNGDIGNIKEEYQTQQMTKKKDYFGMEKR
jgi:hypothetical protein